MTRRRGDRSPAGRRPLVGSGLGLLLAACAAVATAGCSPGSPTPAPQPQASPPLGSTSDLSVPAPGRAGRLLAAGRASDGELAGLGPQPVTSLHEAGLPDSVSAAAGGAHHSLFLTATGHVLTSGANNEGQLGDGSTTDSSTAVEVRAPDGAAGPLTDVVAVAADSDFSMALRSDGTVVTWGRADAGQRGTGDTAAGLTPTTVVAPEGAGPLRGVVAIAADGRTALALRSDGTVVGWGSNDFGQLGTGTTASSSRPVPAQSADRSGPLRGIVGIAVGGQHGVALTADGSVLTWGHNDRGQLGDGTTTDRLLPGPVVGVDGAPRLTGVKAVASAEKFVVALRADGTLVAWGANAAGQLGDGDRDDRGLPAPVLDRSGRPLAGVAQVRVGEAFVVALRSDGTAMAWGAGSVGQLGDGTAAGSLVPVAVSTDGRPVAGAIAVGAGLQHVFVVVAP